MSSKQREDFETVLGLLDRTCCLVATDRDGNILDVNSVFTEQMGYSREEVLGKNPRIFSSGVHPKSFFESLWKCLLEGRTWRGDICNRSKAGELIWMDTIIAPVIRNGSVQKYVALRFNVTGRKAAEARIEAQDAQLVAAGRMATIGELSGHICHEINSPLATLDLIAHNVENLVNKGGPDDRQEILRKIGSIHRVVEKILKIAEGLRRLSRGDAASEKQNITVGAVVQEALFFVESYVGKSGVELRVENGPAFELTLSCQPIQLAQVLINLIRNATDAVRGQESPWIRVDACMRGRAVEIRVRNSGEKISGELAKRVFEPYFTTKGAEKGSGIGLTISRKIAEAHHGSLGVDLTAAETCFLLSLPI